MLIKFGAIVTEARGSIGGHTASRNTYGAYFRTKVTPINPATNSQQIVRSSLTAIAQRWRTLTDAQRAGWSSLASEVSRTNVFGDESKLTAFNMFLRLNRELNNIGHPALTEAPNIPSVASFTSLTLVATVTGGVVSLAFTPTPVPAGHSLVISVTPQLSAGINFVESEYRKIAVRSPGITSPVALTVPYATMFGAPILGKRIFARAKFVHEASGFSSLHLKASTIVAA